MSDEKEYIEVTVDFFLRKGVWKSQEIVRLPVGFKQSDDGLFGVIAEAQTSYKFPEEYVLVVEMTRECQKKNRRSFKRILNVE